MFQFNYWMSVSPELSLGRKISFLLELEVYYLSDFVLLCFVRHVTMVFGPE